MILKFKKLVDHAIIPDYTYEHDIGLNLFSAENFILKVGQRHSYSTGVAMQMPEGHAALFWDRSGLSAKYGLKVLGGVIDPGYRGELLVTLVNLGDEDYSIRKGDRIAQMLVQKVENAKIEIVKELEKSNREEKGFGSSGR